MADNLIEQGHQDDKVFAVTKGAESLFDSTQLKRLFINSFRGKDAAPFGRLAGLERLGILNSSITDLDFLVGSFCSYQRVFE